MGLFSGLKKEDVTDDNWMDQLLSEVELAPEEPTGLVATMSETEGWNFPELTEDPVAQPEFAPDPATPAPPAAPLSFDSGVLSRSGDDLVPEPVPPVTFDRRSEEPGLSASTTPHRATGPSGPRAESMLSSFGLSDGASWTELKAAYLDIRANCDPSMATSPEEAEQLVAIRRDANSKYAALRLTAVA